MASTFLPRLQGGWQVNTKDLRPKAEDPTKILNSLISKSHLPLNSIGWRKEPGEYLPGDMQCG